MLPVRSCSETEKCGHTAPIPPPKPKRLRSSRAARTPWSCTWVQASVKCRVWEQLGLVPCAWRAKLAGKKNRDPPHPDRSIARPARCWSFRDGRGERRTEGHLRPLAGPCRRSEAAERRCRMAAAHGADNSPIVVHEGPSAARSQKLPQQRHHSIGRRQGRNRVWIREIKSMGSEVWTRYGIGSMNEARSGTGIDSILSIYARVASQESTLTPGADREADVRSRTSVANNFWTNGQCDQKAPQREQHNALLTAEKTAPTTPRMGLQSFRKLPQPPSSSHVAMHGV